MISLVMPYYMNPEMLKLQYRAWLQWPKSAREAFEIVIVDDGTKAGLHAADVPFPDGPMPKVRIFRIFEDRPWHQHAARNLGAHVAEGEWLLLTDMDHMLVGRMAEALAAMQGDLDRETAYFLHRIEADTGEPTKGKDGAWKPHPNSFVMSRDLYWRAGGYDEDYCGHYGTDGLFKSRLFGIAKEGMLEDIYLKRFWRDLIPDASTTTLPRKEGRKPGWRDDVLTKKALAGRAGEILTLNFEWTQDR